MAEDLSKLPVREPWNPDATVETPPPTVGVVMHIAYANGDKNVACGIDTSRGHAVAYLMVAEWAPGPFPDAVREIMRLAECHIVSVLDRSWMVCEWNDQIDEAIIGIADGLVGLRMANVTVSRLTVQMEMPLGPG